MQLSRHLRQEIVSDRKDVVVLLNAMASGMIDAVTIPLLSTYVAMQTGNWIFIAVSPIRERLESLHVHPLMNLLSLVGFWFGALVAGQIGVRVGPRTRLFLFFEFLWESALIIFVAILLFAKVFVFGTRTDYPLLLMLAWAYGGNSVTSKGLGVPGIVLPSLVTGSMGDLLSDKRIFVGLTKNKPRNQRILHIVLFFVGAVMGGAILYHANDRLAVLIAGVTKLLGAILVLFLEGKTPEQFVTVDARMHVAEKVAVDLEAQQQDGMPGEMDVSREDDTPPMSPKARSNPFDGNSAHDEHQPSFENKRNSHTEHRVPPFQRRNSSAQSSMHTVENGTC